MNFSLFALTVNQFVFRSPFFSIPISFNALSSHSSFSNMRINNFLNSFYTTQFLTYQSTTFSKSKFSHFLASPISTSKNKNRNKNDNFFPPSIQKRVFKRRTFSHTIYSSEDNELKIIDCLFTNCNDASNGGAIDMLSENAFLSVKKCGFSNCVASYKGGAISFFGDRVEINESCVDNCYSSDSAMAFEFYVEGKTEKIGIFYCSIMNCTNVQFISDFHSNVVDVMNGYQYFNGINSTENAVSLSGGFAMSDESHVFSLKFSTVLNTVSDVLFNFYDMKNFKKTNDYNSNNDIMYCNVINNSGHIALTLFDLENSQILVKHFSFINNNFTFLASNGKLFFAECVTDFDQKNPPLDNANFSDISANSGSYIYFDLSKLKNQYFNFNNLRTQSIQKLETFNCWAVGSITSAPTQSFPSIDNIMQQKRIHNNKYNNMNQQNQNKNYLKNTESDSKSGMFTFVVIAVVGSFIVLFYYKFYKSREININELHDVEMI